MPSVIADNPAVFTGLIRAALAAAVVLGLKISPEQQAAIIVVISMGITLITAQFTVPKAPSEDASVKSLQQPPQ